MHGLRRIRDGWRGVCLVAIAYVYFLIFAQFAFLKRLDELGIADIHLKAVMAAMAAGGILFSLIAARPSWKSSERLRLQAALALCCAAAALSLLSLSLVGAFLISSLIGAGLGLLTVTLVTYLPTWLGTGGALLKVGAGTGIGYFICNLPLFFTASPQIQAIAAAALCGIGIFAANGTARRDVAVRDLADADRPQPPPMPFLFVLLSFTALVWLDSAAFFIIQSTPALKAGTWEGTAHLWTNGTLHLLAALGGAWLLGRRGLRFVLGAAFLALAAACLLLHGTGGAPLASVFYPVGVSLYSVTLVAYPALLSGSTNLWNRARKAALIYAIAGWFGSAMGIGMGQHLGYVPIAFVALAGVVVLSPHLFLLYRRRGREVAASAAVLLVALGVRRTIEVAHPEDRPISAIARGRQVYIAEGCIDCHSQYVRPGSPDVAMWGPVQTLEDLRAQRPPLIGNRRQGPDLSQVGLRRSPLWLKAHFYAPGQVSHASFMPSYAYLFGNGSERGYDLVAYLDSLNGPRAAEQLVLEQAWRPSSIDLAHASANEGGRLFVAYCGTCHNADGATRERWKSSFRRLPPNLETGPWLHLSMADTPEETEVRLARIVKFGIPGTDMPGHEYLPAHTVASIALWLTQFAVHPSLSASDPHLSPDAFANGPRNNQGEYR